MVEISEIKDQDSLEAWLLDRDEAETLEFARVISSRVALRVMPEWWNWVLTAEDAKILDVTALPVLRFNVKSSVVRRWPVSISAYAELDIAVATVTSVNDSYNAANSAYDSSFTNDAYAAAVAASASAASASRVYAFYSKSIGFSDGSRFSDGSGFANVTAIWGDIRNDCARLVAGKKQIFSPLWPDRTNLLQTRWNNIKATVSPEWQFWVNWYQAELDGTPQNRDLLTEVALIDNADWEKGADHINGMIADIEARYALLNEVREMRAEISALRAGRASRETRRSNHPPELVEDEAMLTRSVEIVWAGLGEAEQELEKPDGDPWKLKQAGQKMLAGLKAVVKYIAGLGDIALKKAAAEGGAALGKWGAPVGAAYLAAQEPHVASLAERIIEFAGTLF